jgi:hypothetical protein
VPMRGGARVSRCGLDVGVVAGCSLAATTCCNRMSGWRPARRGGRATRAASAWGVGVADEAARQTPAGATRGPVWASRTRVRTRAGHGQGPGWFINRRSNATPEYPTSPRPYIVEDRGQAGAGRGCLYSGTIPPCASPSRYEMAPGTAALDPRRRRPAPSPMLRQILYRGTI